MPEAAVEAFAVNQAVDPTLSTARSRLERLQYKRFMRRDDVPARTTPTKENEWVGFTLSVRDIDYDSAPSKAAGTWLRQIRLSKALKDKFWSDSWTYLMQTGLSLELRADAPLPRKRKSVKSEGADLAQSSIDGFKKRDGNGKGEIGESS
jgi:hypothetical protein